MTPMHAPKRRSARTLALLVVAGMTLLGCTSPTATGPLGYASAPPDLDPASPVVLARNIAFDRTELGIPALRPVIIVLQNQDTVPHNLSIYSDAAFKQRVFEGVVFDGGGTRWYPVQSLAPGTYFFQCDLHPIPAMQGTIKVV